MIGEEHNLAQTALSFCLAYDAVATVIPGNASMAQLERNLESAKPISIELRRKLEEFYQNEVKELKLPW
jgi:aryl-alcohol dehydrogenase-like predicted oxidoreductase